MQRLAIVLFKYFPFGGLQRDFLGIAQAALAHGFAVDVFTMSWEGERPSDLTIHVLPVKGLTNYRRCLHFVRQFEALQRQQKYHVVIGFNKMPGLDYYYAADQCFLNKLTGLKRYFSRYKIYATFESEVFCRDKKTKILALTQAQIKSFQQAYLTPAERFFLLPPWLNKAKFQFNRKQCRAMLAKELELNSDDKWILHVGSGFRTKGLDRSLRAMASLPRALSDKTIFIIIGQDHPKAFQQLAKKLNIAKQVYFIGGRNDVGQWMAAADLLLHPAYAETAGYVLLEALVSHLPVLTTASCGYAEYIDKAQGGTVLAEPFCQEMLNQHLQQWLTGVHTLKTIDNHLVHIDLDSMPDKVMQHIKAHLIQQQFKPVSPAKVLTTDGWIWEKITAEIPELMTKEKQALIFNWPKIMSLPGEYARKIKDRETLKISFSHDNYYIKRFFSKKYKINNGAKTEHNAIQRLDALNIPTLTLSGFGQKADKTASFLLTQELKQVNLESYCEHWLKNPPSRAEKIVVITQLAATVRVMHHYGINHRDCYLCHFWLDPQQPLVYGSINQLMLTVIDLHRAQMRKRVPRRWQIKDLASILYSAWCIPLTQRDLCRFISVYRGMSWRQVLQQEPSLWRAVIKKAIWIRKREHRVKLTTPGNVWLQQVLEMMP